MPEPYEWAVIRVVPRVERSEFVNAGVVVYSHAVDFLRAQARLPVDKVRALDPEVDVDLVQRHLDALVALCAGAAGDDADADASAKRTAGERFRWIVAPRSTVVQTSVVHTGLTEDPAAELARLASTIMGA